MMDKERSRRIDLARSTLTHALCELDEHHYASALGLAAIAVLHLSQLTGESGRKDLMAVLARVQSERVNVATERA